MVSERVGDTGQPRDNPVSNATNKMSKARSGIASCSVHPSMAIPELPSELVCRIISTARYLERLENLHDSQMWKTVRWYVGNKDVQQVPPSWACSWFIELVRALLNPSVRAIHLRSHMAR